MLLRQMRYKNYFEELLFISSFMVFFKGGSGDEMLFPETQRSPVKTPFLFLLHSLLKLDFGMGGKCTGSDLEQPPHQTTLIWYTRLGHLSSLPVFTLASLDQHWNT